MAGEKKYDVEDICEKLYAYVDHCVRKKKPPILKEVTTHYHWNYVYVTQVMNNNLQKQGDDRLKEAIAYLVDTKEWMLERLGLEGKIDKTVCVFSLKQLGWKDNHGVEMSGGDENNAFRITLKVAE